MMDDATRLYVETKAAEFVAECPWFSLRKASRVATQLSNDLLQESGLRITQLGVLAVIVVEKSATVSTLADELVMDQTTLSRNLKPLERDGLITLTQGEDRRTRFVSLTPHGAEILAEALPMWERAKSAIEEIFGKDKVTSLLEMVSVLSELSTADTP